MLNWQTFWDQFESMINSKTNISNIEKFSYLLSLYVNLLLMQFPVSNQTNQNFLEAFQLLKNCDGNPQLLINTYTGQVVQLEKNRKK